jgi:hypothetical protein
MQRSAVGAYSIEAWTNFALAQTGVAAVLIGLVFVALSINLREIVASASLLDRAVESVVLFGTVLVSSSLVLAPGQERGVLAGELIALAVVSALLTHRAAPPRRPGPGRPRRPPLTTPSQPRGRAPHVAGRRHLGR